MEPLKIKATTVYLKNKQSKKRFVVNQGGSGSSKTYSLAQLFITKALEETGQVYSIVRDSMPSLRASAMRDFFSILGQLNLYDEKDHDKTHNTYTLNGNIIEFFGVEEAQKVRSRRRDYLWINEANELSLESFRQLNIRTNKQVYLDYNPSSEFHWIYDDVIPREDCELIVSTYADNPFLSEQTRKEIEEFRHVDFNYWKIYGLGQRGTSINTIYTHWQLCEGLPEGERIYGLDFGYNHPTSLCEVKLRDNEIYAKEVIYQSYLTNSDLINKMLDMQVSKTSYMFADHSEPQRIKEISDAGFNIVEADKDVTKGIDSIKSRRLYIVKDSANALKELKSYSWKQKDGRTIDEPVKFRDDFVDSLRYAVHTYYATAELLKIGYHPPNVELLHALGIESPHGGIDWD